MRVGHVPHLGRRGHRLPAEERKNCLTNCDALWEYLGRFLEVIRLANEIAQPQPLARRDGQPG